MAAVLLLDGKLAAAVIVRLAEGSHPDGQGSVQDVLIGLTCVLVADPSR